MTTKKTTRVGKSNNASPPHNDGLEQRRQNIINELASVAVEIQRINSLEKLKPDLERRFSNLDKELAALNQQLGVSY